MIIYSDKVREQLPSFFCLKAFETGWSRGNSRFISNTKFFCFSVTKPITIVSDIRRRTDVDYFARLNIPMLAVRINAGEEVRKERGWVYTVVSTNLNRKLSREMRVT